MKWLIVLLFVMQVGCGGQGSVDMGPADAALEMRVRFPDAASVDRTAPDLEEESPLDVASDQVAEATLKEDGEAEPLEAADAIQEIEPPDVPEVAEATLDTFETQGDAGHGPLCGPGDAHCKCKTSEDCDQSYSTFCGVNACNKAMGFCLIASVKPDGTDCDDGDLCTSGDRCVAGQCQGSPVVCNDLNMCTSDSCDPKVGCRFEPKEGYCDDGNACTGPDVCVSGACVGGPQVSCDDHEYCTFDWCDPMKGCLHKDQGGGCDDMNLCTDGDHCEYGRCVPASLVDCSDENQCTADLCDPKEGCVHAPISGPCDDGDPCTIGDKCMGGKCVPGEPGACLKCGDGVCASPDEDCEKCPQDCGQCPPDCLPAAEIGCNGTYHGNTADGTAAISSYGGLFSDCPTLFSVDGPERVVTFKAKDSVHVRVKVAASPPQDIAVLRQNCVPETCVTMGVGLFLPAQTVFDALAGETFYLTVDGTDPAEFTLTTECFEADCGDGADNDHDGLTDCLDADCGGSKLSCGVKTTVAIGDFSHAGTYSPACGGEAGTSDDAVLALEISKELDVSIAVTAYNSQDEYAVYVLGKDGCTGANCFAWAKWSGSGAYVTFHAVPGTYRIVVEETYVSQDSTGKAQVLATCDL